MSEKDIKMQLKYREVIPVAEKLYDLLSPYCEELAIAGSLRRKMNYIGDIEIVVKPKTKVTQKNLLGEPIKFKSELDPLLDELLKKGIFKQFIKNGPKYKQIVLNMQSDLFADCVFEDHIPFIVLDLFVVLPPAEYGVILLIRTGSADYSKGFVNKIRQFGYRSENGAIWFGDKKFSTPSEGSVYQLLNWFVIPPEHRKVFSLASHQRNR